MIKILFYIKYMDKYSDITLTNNAIFSRSPNMFYLGTVTAFFCFFIYPSIAFAFIAGGPNDYYDQKPITRKHLELVEKAHFRPAFQALLAGRTAYSSLSKTGTVWDDLNYTLRWFPNHPQALLYMSKFIREYSQEGNSTIPRGVTAEKYFTAALQFRPNDGTARHIYSIHLHKSGNLEGAFEQYMKAVKLLPESAELTYNIGLLFFDMGKYDKAREYAHKAYARGFPLPGLKMRLMQAGAWTEDSSSKEEDTVPPNSN